MCRTNYKNRSNFIERLVNKKAKQNEGYSGIDSAAQLPHRNSVGKATRAIYNLKNVISYQNLSNQQKKLDASVSKALVEGCMKENGVTQQDIEDLQSGKVKPEDAKDNVKCSTQCILVKSGFMDSTGKLLTDKVRAHYANTKFSDAVEKDLEKCSQVKGENACDTAFKILGCFQGVE